MTSKANIQIKLLEDHGSYIPTIIITDERLGELRYKLTRGVVNKVEAEQIITWTLLAVEAVGLDRMQKMRESKP